MYQYRTWAPKIKFISLEVIIINKESRKIKYIHTFQGFEGMFGVNLIQHESLNVILLTGGMNNKYEDTNQRFCFHSKTWKILDFYIM